MHRSFDDGLLKEIFRQFFVHQLSVRLFARLRRSVGLGPCPMASLQDEMFRIAREGSEEQMRKILQNPQVDVTKTENIQLTALHWSVEFNHDTGVTKVQSSMQKTKAR